MPKITVVLAVAALALGACGSSNDNGSSGGSGSSSSSSASGGGAYGGGGSKTTAASSSSSSSGEVKVDMVDNAFEPKTITGKAGSTVKVELKNTGQAEHNFKIDSQKGVDADVEPGEDKTVSLKIPASGSVQFYCEYHKGLGMVGTVKAS
jgi:plastocyanin